KTPKPQNPKTPKPLIGFTEQGRRNVFCNRNTFCASDAIFSFGCDSLALIFALSILLSHESYCLIMHGWNFGLAALPRVLASAGPPKAAP
ncbi:MAG: hypothetical protein P4M11_12510, partial [Candidatus Pacebacteria bacterium]|nr:hypothetical protein [Candidatus Paceibacterota bacterium]